MPATTGYTALTVGSVVLLPLGVGFTVIAVAVLALVFLLLQRLAMRQIGGQTGDVLGALQQAGEVGLLALAAAALT